MMEDFFEKPRRRSVRELNLVPIIDMFTTVVFFLILSTSFLAYTKLTLPPSKVSVLTDPVAPPPLAPKLFLVAEQGVYLLKLQWAGKEPGEIAEKLEVSEPSLLTSKVLGMAGKAIAGFHGKYPQERSLQIGLGPDVPYQFLISMMDAVQEATPDIVLISYQEAQALALGNAGGIPLSGSGRSP